MRSLRKLLNDAIDPRAILAESRGCVCYVLGALSEIPDRISQEWQVRRWLQLPVFTPLWSRTDFLGSQRYVIHKICLPSQ